MNSGRNTRRSREQLPLKEGWWGWALPQSRKHGIEKMELFCHLKRMVSKHWQRQKQAHKGKNWCLIIYPPAIGITHLGFCCISNRWCQGSVPILLSGYKDFGVFLFILLVLKLSCSNWHGWKSLELEVLVAQKSFSSAAMLLCSRATTCWVEGSKTPWLLGLSGHHVRCPQVSKRKGRIDQLKPIALFAILMAAVWLLYYM